MFYVIVIALISHNLSSNPNNNLSSNLIPIKGWASITCGKFLYIVGGEKFIRVVDVGSWHLSCRCSKNTSHQTACAMTLFNVEGYGKVTNKSFTSLHNPN
jgi:hypothetical protein